MPELSTPSVSVLMPAYNASRWIEDSLRSVLRQTISDFEVIVVDDGSRDDTFDAARRVKDPRIRVIKQENQGASAARNRAFAESRGRFIQYLDADDLLAEGKLERQIAILRLPENARAVVACSCRQFWDGDPPELGKVADDPMRLGTSPEVAEWYARLLGGGGIVQPGAWLCPREVALDAGPWDETLTASDDGEYFCRVVLASSKVVATPHADVFYRKHRHIKSLSTRLSRRDLKSRNQAAISMAKHLFARHDSAAMRDAMARHCFANANLAYPRFRDLSRDAIAECMRYSQDTSPYGNYLKLELVRRLFGWKAARGLRFILEALVDKRS